MESRWKTVRFVAKIIEFVGWILLCLGLVMAIMALSDKGSPFAFKLMAALPGIGFAFSGLLAVCIAQLVQVFIATEEGIRLLVERHEHTNKMLGEVLGSYKVNLDQIVSAVRKDGGRAGDAPGVGSGD